MMYVAEYLWDQDHIPFCFHIRCWANGEVKNNYLWLCESLPHRWCNVWANLPMLTCCEKPPLRYCVVILATARLWYCDDQPHCCPVVIACFTTACDDLLHQCYMMTYLIAVMWWPTSPLLCDDLFNRCYMITYFTTVMWWPTSLLCILWCPTSQP